MLRRHPIATGTRLAGKYAISLMIAAGMLFAAGDLPLYAQVELTVDTTKRDYLLEEQVYVTVTARNTGSSSVRLYGNLQPESPFLDVLVARPGEPFAALDLGHASATKEDWERSAAVLEPGDVWSASLDLTLHGNAAASCMESLLSQPGIYTVRIAYSPYGTSDGGEAAIVSSDLELSVSQPERAEAAAYSLLSAGKEEAGWNTVWIPTVGRIAIYEAVAAGYPQSEYADDALFYLAAALNAQVWGKEGTEAALSNYQRAAGCLESVALAAGDSPLGVRAMRLAASYYGRVGDIRRAQELFQEAIVAPAATDDDRRTGVLWLQRLEEGGWQQYGRPDHAKVPVQISVPLRSLACALGYTVNWDGKAKSVELRSTGVSSTLQPTISAVCINGEVRTGARVAVADGVTYVSPNVIATLVAASKGDADILPATALLAKAR